MATKKQKSLGQPATTVEGRENQMISLAMDLAEKQMREGTASAMVISHYLKLGSTREQMERERLVRENELLQAKVETLASTKRIEDLYAEALRAMKNYAGHPEELEELEEDTDY